MLQSPNAPAASAQSLEYRALGPLLDSAYPMDAPNCGVKDSEAWGGSRIGFEVPPKSKERQAQSLYLCLVEILPIEEPSCTRKIEGRGLEPGHSSVGVLGGETEHAPPSPGRALLARSQCAGEVDSISAPYCRTGPGRQSWGSLRQRGGGGEGRDGLRDRATRVNRGGNEVPRSRDPSS